MKLDLLIFLIKFRHRYGIPCRGWNVNILSLDQSNSQDRQQTDGSISPTVRIEVGNFPSTDPIVHPRYDYRKSGSHNLGLFKHEPRYLCKVTI